MTPDDEIAFGWTKYGTELDRVARQHALIWQVGADVYELVRWVVRGKVDREVQFSRGHLMRMVGKEDYRPYVASGYDPGSFSYEIDGATLEPDPRYDTEVREWFYRDVSLRDRVVLGEMAARFAALFDDKRLAYEAPRVLEDSPLGADEPCVAGRST